MACIFPAPRLQGEKLMTKHCKKCVHHNVGMAGTKYEDWCCKHSTIARKAKSICILQGSKKLKGEL